jgi:hypothetical protein
VEAGTSPDAPDPGPAWAAFGRFARERIAGLDPERDEDLLLFEVTRTRHGSDGEPAVQIDLERQYGGEGAMRSILCSFAYGMEAAVPGAQAWGRPGADAEAWIARVEAAPAFALLSRAPRHASVESGAI